MNIFKGWFGEKITTLNLWLTLDGDVYKRFHNTIVPSYNGTTQIDHILISRYGIFIIETKNKSGWIFGSGNQPNWTQSIYGKKYSFQNPLRQTFRQKKILAEFLSIDMSFIHTVIYFVGECKFKTAMPRNVINTDLSDYIKSFTDDEIHQDDVNQIVAELAELRTTSNLTTGDHVRSLKQRRNSTTVCPNCGSSLKAREVKNGPKAGSKFLGCESFPVCRFTRSI